MTWYFYDDTVTPWERIRRGHEISDPENRAFVDEASVAMAAIGIGPIEGERFQTMLSEGEVSFVGVNVNDRPILATQVERSHPFELKLLGKL